MYIKVHFKSQMLMRSVGVQVFLPWHDGYEGAAKPYPTLYLLPGYSASAEELATLLPLRRFATEHGIAIVIPDGENSFYTDHPERCALFAGYVGEELVRVTRAMFPSLSARREDTFIGGISMGGFGACVNGLRQYGTFSKLLLLSPAIDPVALTHGDKAALPECLFGAWLGDEAAYKTSWLCPKHAIEELLAAGKALPDMFMCCGRQDELVYEACKDFADYAQEKNLPLTYIEADGLHDIPFWDGMLEPAFAFLAPLAKEEGEPV